MAALRRHALERLARRPHRSACVGVGVIDAVDFPGIAVVVVQLRIVHGGGHALLQSSVDPDEEPSCGAAWWHCADAMAYCCSACGSVSLSCYTVGIACATLGKASSQLFSDGCNLPAIYSSIMSCGPCFLPKPPRKADDEIAGGEDEEDMAAIDDPASPGKVQQRKREEHLMLVLWLAGASAVMFLWNTWQGGLGLSIWSILGGASGLLGAAAGAGLAALTTPIEYDVESPQEWMKTASESDLLHGRNATVALSLAGAAALSAFFAGVVAWSIHEYETRAPLLWLVNLGLLVGFFARYCFKVWRAGGCLPGGRLRIMTRAGCGCTGCVWPALL